MCVHACPPLLGVNLDPCTMDAQYTMQFKLRSFCLVYIPVEHPPLPFPSPPLSGGGGNIQLYTPLLYSVFDQVCRFGLDCWDCLSTLEMKYRWQGKHRIYSYCVTRECNIICLNENNWGNLQNTTGGVMCMYKVSSSLIFFPTPFLPFFDFLPQ